MEMRILPAKARTSSQAAAADGAAASFVGLSLSFETARFHTAVMYDYGSFGAHDDDEEAAENDLAGFGHKQKRRIHKR